MGKLRFGWAALLGVAAAALLVPVMCPRASAGENIPKLDRSWKRYRNPAWSFCVSYPKRWIKGDALEGAGLFVEAGAKKDSRPTGEIDVTALPVPDPEPKLNLVDNLQVHLDGLKRFERVQKIDIIDQHELRVQGRPALFSKARYTDPLNGGTWIEEMILSENAGTLFRIELECRADEAGRFESVFSRLADSFQFNCAD